MSSSLLCPLCFFLLLLPHSTRAQTNTNITLGSSLTASADENSSWISPSGDFAFGFQQVAKGGFLLAVWFNKVSDKTIVWSANRDALAPTGSKVQLTADGQLVLNNPEGGQIWEKNPVGSGAAYAAMLDTGNFVLASQYSDNLWGTFDEPTDTILPTQTLRQNMRLYARYSETNYSKGRFAFILQNDGNLVLYTTAFPNDPLYSAYWDSKTVGSGFQVIFNQSGNIYLTSSNGSILDTDLPSITTTMTNFYQRAVIEYDGVFRLYVHPKNASSSAGRPMAWSKESVSTPSDICMGMRIDVGGGVCGFNSICRLGDEERPSCECPPGYTLMDPNNKMSGCKQNFDSQSCDTTSKDIHLFDLQEMENTDWPLSDYEHFQPATEDYCRAICLDDCFCAVAIFRNGDCWKKRMPLSNGKIDTRVGGKALIKVRKGNSTDHRPGVEKKKDQSTVIRIVSVLLGSSIFIIFLFLLATFLVIFHKNKQKQKVPKPYQVMNLRNFTYEELEKATDGFKEELGRGAFSIVYKGVLLIEDPIFVAVKKLDKITTEGDKEFKTEVNAIGRTNHKNLAQLLGFCNEGQHRLLVYEFMSNGSLASFLYGNSRPSWEKRKQIAFGTARGLFYLHEECSTQIIHCDIKPQNILLDDSFTARICDFGLAKLLKKDQSRTATVIRGTKGYVATEWFKNMPISVKVDVYSFGIVLLELIFCRKNLESDVMDENQGILSEWVCDCYKDGSLDQLLENDEEAMEDMRRVEKFVMIAIWCIQEDPSLRPTMKKVTQMLEGVVEVSIPPDPFSFINSI